MEYAKYENMLKKIAGSFANSSGLPFEDLLSELNLAFCSALNRFNPDKGMKFSTYLYSTGTCSLINYVEKEKNWLNGRHTDKGGEEGIATIDTMQADPQKHDELAELFEDSPIWRDMLALGVTTRVKNVKCFIKKELRKKYKHQDIWDLFSQVNQFVTN